MKQKNLITIALEQLYASSGITEPEAKWAETKDEDVPFGPQNHDKEYKTFIPFPPMSEDIEEPELRTKKGKNILREPPGDPDAEPDDIDVDMIDRKGNEIKGWEDSDTDILSEQNKKEKDLENEIDGEEDSGAEDTEDPDSPPQDDIDPATGNVVTDPDAPPEGDVEPLAQGMPQDQSQVDPNTGMPMNQGMSQDQSQVDPNTGMPMNQGMTQGQTDPMAGMAMNQGMPQGQTDPNTGMPMDQGMTQGQTDPMAGMSQGQTDPMTGMPMDQGMGGMGGGMPGVEPTRTPEIIGRIFELKKIYTRLLSIDSQLSFSADDILIKLRKYISQAIELFEIVIANEKSFENDMDEIIVYFYEFLSKAYEIIKHYYQIKEDEEKKEKKK